MIFDITRPVHHHMAIYPGNPAVVFDQLMVAGDTSSALTKISLGSHTGTHIDAPSHIEDGAVGTDHYSLESMIGPCEVLDLTSASSVIEASDIPSTSTPRLIMRTSNSSGDLDVFDPAFVALGESAAQELVKRNIQLVGIDALSIKKKGEKNLVHKLLLDAGIVIVEGLWLKDIEPGLYELLCLPLAVQGLDGAPVRAVLRK